MPGGEILLPFVVTVLLLSITPGPGMLYIAAQTVGRGRNAGWFSALGTHLASYVHIIATAFGLSFFLEAVPVAYLALKIVGALFLFWMGIRFLMAEEISSGPESHSEPEMHFKALRESFVVEVTNPKSAVFFVAFLPQFTDQGAAYPVWLQIILLGVAANLFFSFAEAGCVIFANQIAGLFRKYRSAGSWMRRAAGSVLIALGANLLISER
ncbi:LysE family translocator [Roseibium album]|uniref:LysE family translocator n=1 Tax=Roseibium album TaxID=311410 RepID=UPI00391C6AE5